MSIPHANILKGLIQNNSDRRMKNKLVLPQQLKPGGISGSQQGGQHLVNRGDVFPNLDTSQRQQYEQQRIQQQQYQQQQYQQQQYQPQQYQQQESLKYQPQRHPSPQLQQQESLKYQPQRHPSPQLQQQESLKYQPQRHPSPQLQQQESLKYQPQRHPSPQYQYQQHQRQQYQRQQYQQSQQQRQQHQQSAFALPETKQTAPVHLKQPQMENSFTSGQDNTEGSSEDDNGYEDDDFALDNSRVPLNSSRLSIQDTMHLEDEKTEEEVIMSKMIKDPVLLKNTSFNASLIQVPSVNLSAPRNPLTKKIVFSENIEEITSPITNGSPSSSSNESEDKNLAAIAFALNDSQDTSILSPEKINHSEETKNYKPLEYMESSFHDPSTITNPEGSNYKAPSEIQKQADINKNGTKEQGSYFLPDPLQKAYNDRLEQRKSFHETPTFLKNSSLKPMPLTDPPSLSKMMIVAKNSESRKIDHERDDLVETNYKLLNCIAKLDEQLYLQQEESRIKLQSLQEQVIGFEKSSAQTFKKIKDLSTEKTIMSIEIKSLRKQIDKVLDNEIEL